MIRTSIEAPANDHEKNPDCNITFTTRSRIHSACVQITRETSHFRLIEMRRAFVYPGNLWGEGVSNPADSWLAV